MRFGTSIMFSELIHTVFTRALPSSLSPLVGCPHTLFLRPKNGTRPQIKEDDGDVAGAAEVLQEVHVETYGALTKKEKADFILEQVGAAENTSRKIPRQANKWLRSIYDTNANAPPDGMVGVVIPASHIRGTRYGIL